MYIVLLSLANFYIQLTNTTHYSTLKNNLRIRFHDSTKWGWVYFSN